MSRSNCRFCGQALKHVLADLGTSPLANSCLTVEQLAADEPTYPLEVMVCDGSYQVQLP